MAPSCNGSACNGEKERKATEEGAQESHPVSNEYVLNVAFLSFLLFTAVQFFFAFLAHSQSMLCDCIAMSVDVISYFVNFMAERLKHGHHSDNPQQLRLKRLYLELLPPGLSVITLIVVTAMALQVAIETLINAYRGHDTASPPDVKIMLLFSGFNLLLDVLNVTCFARADQAVGLPGQHGNEDIHVHFDRPHEHHDLKTSASETTPLVVSRPNNSKSNSPVYSATSSSRQDSTVVEDDDDSSISSEVDTKGLNLNMCSAWTHVCADTLRSIAVLAAAGFSFVFPELLTPVEADSWATVLVGLIILASLVPLLQGLYSTAVKIHEIWMADRDEETSSNKSSHSRHMVMEV